MFLSLLLTKTMINYIIPKTKVLFGNFSFLYAILCENIMSCKKILAKTHKEINYDKQ